MELSQYIFDPKDSALEIERLQRSISDVVSVLALPAVWSGKEPRQIVTTFHDALMAMLNLDFVYTRASFHSDGKRIEELTTCSLQTTTAIQDKLSEALNDRFEDDPWHWPQERTIHIDGHEVSALSMKLGFQGEIGMVVAGSERADFPTQNERLLLSVAVNQAAIGLQQAHLLSEQKKITEELDRRVAERTRELAEANKELQLQVALLQQIPVSAWTLKPDGTPDFVNQVWLEFSGQTLDFVRSHPEAWMTAVHPEDRESAAKAFWEGVRSEKGFAIETRSRRAKDGVYRWHLQQAVVLRDAEGRVLKYVGTTTDIDDQKRAEEKVLRSEAFLAEAQRLTRIGSFSWRTGIDEVKWSAQLYQIFEFDPEKPVTFDLIRSRFHPEDIPLLDEMIDRTRRGESDLEYEHRIVMPDGTIKHLQFVAHAGRDSEGQLEYIGAIQDVTQRQLAEAESAWQRAELAKVTRITSLGALTASIAHEVNQPLSGILINAKTCLKMLNSDPPNIDGARETMHRTIRDGNRASDVITRLRALFSRKEITVEPVDLNDATREVIALLSSDLQRDRVVLQLELADPLPPLKGDRVQLQQVVLNLVRNASEAMSGIEDRARKLIVRTEHDGGDIRLTVQDSGIGISDENAEQIFESFFTTKEDGMGVGLSVSRSIIEAHQGRLWAKANDGPGSSFIISIPFASDS